MVRVVVTGGCGRLGRYVARSLAALHDVSLLDRVIPSRDLDLPFALVDLLDRDALERAFVSCDVIVHLAARDLSTNANDVEYLTTNVIGTWNVCQAALAVGVPRLILASSTAALGLFDEPWLRPSYLPIDEHHSLKAPRPYGISKVLAEKVGENVVCHALSVVSLRFPVVAFPSIIPEMRQASRLLSEPRLFCYVTPEDAANGVCAAIDRGPDGWSVFNIAARDSYLEIPTLDALHTVHGGLPEIRNPSLFENDPQASALDISSAIQVLGYSPSSNWLALSAAAQ